MKFYGDKLSSISTHTTSYILIDNDKNGVEMEIKKYRSIIESLVYLKENITDIIFNVYMCTRFQESPRESNLKIVKRIVRNLNETSFLSI